MKDKDNNMVPWLDAEDPQFLYVRVRHAHQVLSEAAAYSDAIGEFADNMSNLQYIALRALFIDIEGICARIENAFEDYELTPPSKQDN